MPSRIADLKRASHVINTCAKQGLGYFVELYGLKWHLHLFKRICCFREKTLPESLPRKIRNVMEELGGAYVKLGQVLSIRPDLIPNEYCEEFKHLRDDMAPSPFSDIKKTIESELKQPLSKIFAQIDKNPIGSASVAQVHKAKLHNGKNIVVKVQRQGVDKKFKEDIDILYYLAHKIEKHSDLKKFRPVAIIEEFDKYTNKELNFQNEARNIDKFYQNFKNTETVKIPKVEWLYTTQKVLTMEYLAGTKLSEIKKLSTNDKKIITYRLADASLKQLFELGVFHADLHPGNILILPNNKIGLLDFGIVGNINEEILQKLMNAYIGVIQRDATLVNKSILEIAPASADTNVEDLKEEITTILEEWFVSVQQTRYTQMMYLIFQIGIRHKLNFPRDLILFSKAAMTAEGTCTEIYPEFNFANYSKPKMAELMRKQHAPTKAIKQFLQKSASFGENIVELPGAAVSLINKLEKQPFKIGIDNTDVRHLGFDINTSSNRLSYSMLIASLIIAGALLINIGPAYKDYSLISIVVFLIAGIMLVPLLVSVLHEGTKKYDAHNN